MSEFKDWQIIQRHVGAGIDGDPGPETARKVLAYLKKHQENVGNDGEIILPPPPPPLDLDPVPINSVARFPIQTQKNMFKVFGTPGRGMTTVKCPYELELSWDRKAKLNKFACHALVHDSLSGILNDVYNHYGKNKIIELGLNRFGGCVNVRKKRGGSSWSIHAWGAAVDFWPEKNWLTWDHTRAVFAKPEYEAFFDIVEAHGWSSLGRHADFDWMHIQAPPFK